MLFNFKVKFRFFFKVCASKYCFTGHHYFFLQALISYIYPKQKKDRVTMCFSLSLSFFLFHPPRFSFSSFFSFFFAPLARLPNAEIFRLSCAFSRTIVGRIEWRVQDRSREARRREGGKERSIVVSKRVCSQG